MAEKINVHHPILDRIHSLDGDVQGRTRIYDGWASTYDKDTIECLGYLGPTLAADRVAKLVPTDTPLLDAGCGTGLVGGELAQRGFSVVDGVDLSPGMLDIARSKGTYRRLELADITRPLPFAPDSYGAVVCVGTFTAAHVGPEGIGPLIAVAWRGAYLVMTVLSQVWDEMGFSRYVKEVHQRGIVRVIDEQADQTYLARGHITCRVVVLQVA